MEDKDDPRQEQQEEAVASTKGEHSKGDMAMPPAREVPNCDTHTKHDNANTVYEAPIEHNLAPICVVSEVTPESSPDYMSEISTEELVKDEANIFTRGMIHSSQCVLKKYRVWSKEEMI